MPILWRFLISQYLTVFFLCVATFVGILLTIRLEEIAHFATLGPEGLAILLFILHQIPYILPIAFPLAGLISGILLMQRLSSSHELTAMRAAGFGLSQVLAPVLLVSLFLSLGNLYIASEMATHSHLNSGLLKTHVRAINPLILAHNKHLLKMKGIYFDTMGPSKMGESASDVIFAMPDKDQSRINLVLAKNIKANAQEFVGSEVTLMSGLPATNQNQYDSVVIENIGKTLTTVEEFTQLLEKKVWTVHNDHLQMPLLLVRLDDEKKAMVEAKSNDRPVSEIKQIQRNINRIYVEMMRRLSLGMAVFSFTLMGVAFGISISRNKSAKGIIWVALLSSLYLITFFVGKGVEHLLSTAMVMYLTPHLLMMITSLWVLRKAAKGIE